MDLEGDVGELREKERLINEDKSGRTRVEKIRRDKSGI
jgi:hypothetical protein